MRRAKFAISTSLLLAVSFIFGFGWRDVRSGAWPSVGALSELFGRARTTSQAADAVFRNAYNRITSDYIRPVEPKTLKYAGMGGMMAALGDPHTLFLPQEAARAFAEDTQGTLVGIGAKLARDPLGTRVDKVFEGTPAYRAGLRKGDVITGVDGKPVAGKDVDEIVAMVRGEEGKIVKLTVIKPGSAKPVVLSIKRARIVAPTIESQYFADSHVGLMVIYQFAENTPDQFDHELASLEKEDLRGLVIDLRGNPGGLLQSTVEMLSRFVEDKLVVKMRSRDGAEEVARTFSGYRSDGLGVPIIVLVNEDTASAAEIFAGVLHDYRLATIVGEHTYGKASVQNIFSLRDGSSAKVTIARYFLPSGVDIGRRVDEDGLYISGGLQPDIKFVPDPDDPDIKIGDSKHDPQLRKAIDLILAKQPKD